MIKFKVFSYDFVVFPEEFETVRCYIRGIWTPVFKKIGPLYEFILKICRLNSAEICLIFESFLFRESNEPQYMMAW